MIGINKTKDLIAIDKEHLVALIASTIKASQLTYKITDHLTTDSDAVVMAVSTIELIIEQAKKEGMYYEED